MNMKSYIATYFRHNPQFKSGGYETTRKITAVSLRPLARERGKSPSTVFTGSMELLDVRKEA